MKDSEGIYLLDLVNSNHYLEYPALFTCRTLFLTFPLTAAPILTSQASLPLRHLREDRSTYTVTLDVGSMVLYNSKRGRRSSKTQSVYLVFGDNGPFRSSRVDAAEEEHRRMENYACPNEHRHAVGRLRMRIGGQQQTCHGTMLARVRSQRVEHTLLVVRLSAAGQVDQDGAERGYALTNWGERAEADQQHGET
ncbi:uncharacterized protein LAESUDRAFT_746922 [Laetiporus sulphureus 93-53]|uniref:Uncharacterized protein n=1 Tax=Laetiporus sulphureus 93-53 TaxID=1314785 RepID=A0A165HWZ0_9APHY|nr:uncharacterized protein LAESUDRAFT_746922 [Laetiporus sulphureus 93-53]KZT12298.1 hypothetical protein LAESUDRAFT_746922 [Laetiporus sulphureus 93-53]